MIDNKTSTYGTRATIFLANMRYEHLVAGISGGVASTLILHPLDLIKIRFAGNATFSVFDVDLKRSVHLSSPQFQVTCDEFLLTPFPYLCGSSTVSDGQLSIRPQYTGLVDAISSITRTEGLKGLYRGVAPNVWGAGAAWGSYFFL